MMNQPNPTKSDEQLRKANRRVAIILGLIALAAMAYPFFFLPDILAGAGG
jgi:hypothetical protein